MYMYQQHDVAKNSSILPIGRSSLHCTCYWIEHSRKKYKGIRSFSNFMVQFSVTVGGMESTEVDPRVAPWVCEASDVIDLKLVATEADIDDDSAVFHPEFTHQVCGQRYENPLSLALSLSISAHTLSVHLSHTNKHSLYLRHWLSLAPSRRRLSDSSRSSAASSCQRGTRLPAVACAQ
jgi:hypothetical protein